ncbi:MAG: glycosyltransferase family 4 protein [Anaerolineae bacterium]
MRVLMISKALVVGIYQRKLEAIARHTEIDLTVLVPSEWRDPSGVQPLEYAHTEGYHLIPTSVGFNGDYHLHYYPALPRLLRRYQPQLVHIDEEPYNLATWHALYHAKKIGAKAVFFAWQNIYRRYPPPFAWGERWTLRAAAGAIAGTPSAAQVLKQKGCTLPMLVLPQFGVDPHDFAPSNPPDGTPVIGFVGRLRPEKGADLLIRAAARLRDQGQLFQVVIVGQGPYREALQALVTELDLDQQVSFVGQVKSTEMKPLYASFSALVLPSRTARTWKEQFGRVLIEAMACGVPVIGAESGDIPYVIGDAGLTFPEGDVLALADRIAAVLSDPFLAAHLRERGRSRVVQHFTHERIAALTVDFYHRLEKGT